MLQLTLNMIVAASPYVATLPAPPLEIIKKMAGLVSFAYKQTLFYKYATWDFRFVREHGIAGAIMNAWLEQGWAKVL